MKAPKPFGYPLVVGHVKKRLAKKIISRCRRGYGQDRDMWKRFQTIEKLKVGDLVSDCSGFNDRIVKVEPNYVATKHGLVLIDLEFQLAQMSCDMYHCGIDLPLTYEEAKANLEWFKKAYQEDTNPEKDPTPPWWCTVTLNSDGTYTYPRPS